MISCTMLHSSGCEGSAVEPDPGLMIQNCRFGVICVILIIFVHTEMSAAQICAHFFLCKASIPQDLQAV